MSQKILLDLAMKLSANSAELKRGVEESNRHLSDLNARAANVGREVTASFAKVAGAVAMVRGGMSQLKDVLESTMTTADALRRVTDGMAGAMGSFNRSMASGNFSGFIQNMQNAYRAAEQYSDILDELSKKQMAVSLQDISLATDIFRLDQVIYADDSTEGAVRAALAEKERLYKEHYHRLNQMAEENRQALLQRMTITFGSELGASQGEVQRAWDYMTSYFMFDEERKEAERYFEALSKISDLENRRASQAAGSGARVRTEGSADFTGQLRNARAEADRLYASLDGMSKWLVDNAKLVDFVTPMAGQIDEAERMIRNNIKNYEQAIAGVTREQRRIGGRFRGSSQPEASGIISQIDGEMGPFFEDWQRINIGLAIDQNDFDNVMVTIQALNEEIKRLSEIRFTMAPDQQGYDSLNERIELLQEIIKQRTQLTFEDVPESLDLISSKMEEVRAVSEAWRSSLEYTTTAIASMFVDLAFGVERSVNDMIKSMLRFLAVQALTNIIGNVFAPGAGTVVSGAVAATSGLQYGPAMIAGGGTMGGGGAVPAPAMGGGSLGAASGPLDVFVHGRLTNDSILISNNRAARRTNMIE